MKLRRRVAIATAAMLAFTLASCGPQASDPDPATDGAQPTEGGAATDDTTEGGEAGDGNIDPNGSIQYGYNTSLSSFDPAKATLSQDNVWLFPVYDRLVHEQADGQSVPGLATEWEYSEDGLSLTMQLREGVTFHDGEAFDAEAVKANIERGQTLPDSIVQSDLSVIESIEVLGTHEVQFNLTGQAPQLVAIVSDRGGAMVSPAAFDNEDLGLAPVGAGMFTVSEYVPGGSATYEQYEGYWDTDAQQLAELEIVLVEDPNAQVNALKSGELDWTGVRTTDVPDFEADANFELELFTNLGYQYLMLNRGREGLDDVRVRQAINYALDREAFNMILGGGLSVPCTQVFPPGTPMTRNSAVTPTRTIRTGHASSWPRPASRTD